MPTAREVADDLLRRIRQERLQPGDPLETDLAVARRYDISPDVARRAWMHLVRAGIVERKQGDGTYVSDGSSRLTVEERVAELEAWRARHESGHPLSSESDSL